MRALGLLFLLALAPAAAAQPVCTQYGCVNAEDTDGDGDIDWASAAVSVEHALTLNVNYNESKLLAQLDVGTEETLEPYHLVVLAASIDEDGGADGGWLFVELIEGDEETGAATQLAAVLIFVTDTDGDGVPDEATATTYPPLP